MKVVIVIDVVNVLVAREKNKDDFGGAKIVLVVYGGKRFVLKSVERTNLKEPQTYSVIPLYHKSTSIF